LHFAIKQRNIKAIKLLIEKNASLNVKNKGNMRPGEIADEELKSFINELVNKKKMNENGNEEILGLVIHFYEF